MCPECPEGFRTERPWTEDVDCSQISCKCIPTGQSSPKKPCPMIHCPGGRFGACRNVDGCDFCECLPICPPIPPVCPKECKKGKRRGCPFCHCTVKPPVCPLAMCAMYCEHGFERDDKGCNICKCRKCPLGMCRMYCKNGFQKNEFGCEICECKPDPKPLCPPVMCKMHCKHGFLSDKDGCPVCKCRQCPPQMCRQYCRFGFQRGKDGCPLCKCRRMPTEIRPMKVGMPGTQG
eukprot:gene2551-747_t